MRLREFLFTSQLEGKAFLRRSQFWPELLQNFTDRQN